MDRSLRKNYVIVVCICVGIISAICAGNDEEFFLRGNNYYKQKDYDNALQSYEMIRKKGRAALYNIGNCFFHKTDYSNALVYWSRAEIGSTAQELRLIERNKEYVLKKIGKETEQSLQVRLFKLFHSVLPYVSLLFLQLCFLLCWYFFIFLARNKQKNNKKFIVACLCVTLLLCGTLLHISCVRENVRNAIVMKKEIALFSGPDKGFHALAPLEYADSVVVKEVREGWYKVQYADMIGWVESGDIQII